MSRIRLTIGTVALAAATTAGAVANITAQPLCDCTNGWTGMPGKARPTKDGTTCDPYCTIITSENQTTKRQAGRFPKPRLARSQMPPRVRIGSEFTDSLQRYVWHPRPIYVLAGLHQ